MEPRATLPWPLPVVAAVCVLGNVAVHSLPALPGPQWLVPAAMLAVLAMSVRALRLVAIAATAFAYTACTAGHRLDDRLAPEHSGGDFSVTGWVDAFPDRGPVRTTFSLRVERADAGVPERLRLAWYDARERIEPAQRFELTVRLRAPRGLLNPGGFDYERWLLLEGYGATGYVRRGRRVPADSATLPQRWLALRAELARRIGASGLERDAAALVTALTLGERSSFDDAHWRVLRRTGTTHLVAISGMHIGLLALGVFWFVRRSCLWLPGAIAARDLGIAALASGAVAAVYAALAGFALPTQRALLMLAVALWVVTSRRKVARFDGFAIALVLVLAFDPLASLTASFWLSFGAVALLLALAGVQVPRFTRARSARARGLGGYARLQWCLSLGLVPLVVVHFGELSFSAPFVNLAAIPWFSVVLVPAGLLALAGHAFGWSLPLFDALLGRAADLTWTVLEHIADRPWAAMSLPEASTLAALTGAAAVVCGLPWHALPGRRLAWLGLAPLLVATRSGPAPGHLHMTVLDVGHGLAVLVETAGHRLLYDAGPVSRSGFDAGAELLVPVLARRPDAGLDLLIVGHGHSDHAGGAPAVLDAYPGAHVLRGPDVDALEGEVCRAGQRWDWDGVEFAILHPPPGFAPRGNDSSCVLRVSTPRHRVLLTGDIERRAEAGLPAAELEADVVVVPHHGSATSSTAPFAAAVAPELAIVSAGFDNRWGFPRPEVRSRWASVGADMVVTGESGAVEVRLGEGALELSTERAVRRRYWRAEPSDLPGDPNYGAL